MPIHVFRGSYLNDVQSTAREVPVNILIITLYWSYLDAPTEELMKSNIHPSRWGKLNDLSPDEGAGNLGVDEAVAHDQDVDECLPKGASVLHLPYSLVGKESWWFF